MRTDAPPAAATPRRAIWTRADVARMAVVQGLQIPPILLAIFGRGDAALWTAALIGSSICCAGTDSGWRWRNRTLVLQAVLWLLFPPLFPR